MLPLIIFVVFFLLDLAKEASGNAKGKQLSQQCTAKQREATRHRAEAKRLSSPADFAASAKLQRKAVALEAECLKLEEARAAAVSNGRYRGLQAAAIAASVVFVVVCWKQAVAEVDPAFLWPVGRWLRQPHGKNIAGLGTGLGAITALPWIALCKRASTGLVRGWDRLNSRLRT